MITHIPISQTILLTWSQHGVVSSCLPYRENYVDQYIKTIESDVFHYCKLNCAKIIRPQQMIFQYNILKCITYVFSVFW